MNVQPGGFLETLTALPARQWSRTTAEGNRPFFLDGQDCVWIVETGRVDLFSVQVGASETAGRRRHLASFTKGECLFGSLVRPDSAGYRLMAAGTLDTSLIVVGRRLLFDLLLDGGAFGEGALSPLGERLGIWVERLTEGVLPGVPPRSAVLLPADRPWEPKSPQTVRSQNLCWCRIADGTPRWLGRCPVPADEKTLFPLSSRGWIESEGPARLVVERFPREKDACRERLERSLDRFLDVLLTTVSVVVGEERAREERRRNERELESLASEAEARRRLLQLPGNEELAAFSAADGGDALLAAFRLVSDAAGHELPRIRPSPLGKSFDSGRFEEIASMAGIRYRQVILSGSWWTQECGPLLACFDEGREPVALLPDGRGYRLVAPGSPNPAIRVDARLASRLSAFAYTLYRPFPNRALTLPDIIRFGFHGARSDFMQLLLLSLLTMLFTMTIPFITGVIFDRAVPESDLGLIGECMLALVVAAIVSSIWSYARVFPLLRSQARTNSMIQNGMIDRLLRLPTAFFRQFSTGDLCARALSVNGIRHQMGTVVIDTLFSLLVMGGQLGVMLCYSPQLTLCSLAIAFLGTIVFVGVGTVVRSQLRDQTTLEARQSSFLLQAITGIAKLKVAGAESRAFRSWSEIFGKQKRAAFVAGTWQNLLGTFDAAFPTISSVLIFATASDQLQKAQSIAMGTASGLISEPVLTLAQFMAFNAAASIFTGAMMGIGGNLLSVLRIIPELERMEPILAAVPEVTERKSDPGELTGMIDLTRVSFRYHAEGGLVLNDLTLRVLPGEFVALVGPSGSGKSTLLRLLLGFEKPESGGVHFDGRNLADLDVVAVRRQIGVVLQSGRLSAGTMFQLIAGSARHTLDEAWEAAANAGLAEDIRAMPMQMHTVIGDGGVTLSGGQRQRLLIARALIKKPRIILFDEATSALDNATQAIVSESLGRLNATRLVIAHRLSTIQHADRIIVLKEGRAVESGSFDELMARDELFAGLARRQMA
ncbi:MAG TPA: NHLP bacteriocin export ABC transporter permease/ATPase subunit [Candidatus Ozemobacteraceae bacterium]|nr:NHLP bacteriocin export ABC transporter permease/ATPase subunit [Candidatus Ozemobacteraceae bacterium]